MIYRVFYTPTSKQMVDDIEQPFRKTVKSRVRGLKQDPEKQGRALSGPLLGLRRIVVAGRYRVIYRVERKKVIVIVLAAGIRKAGDKHDIYELTKRLIRLGLFDV